MIAVLALFIVCFSPLSMLVPVRAQRTAVILSSLDSVVPFNYYGSLTERYLESAGYRVTMLKDQQVTLDLLTSGLNKFDIVIWRTDVYSFNHREFWYVGERVDSEASTEYSADFSSNLLDVHAGIIGASQDFFLEHWSGQSLKGVKLAILLASDTNVIGQMMINAGVTTVIYCANDVSLEWGQLDDLTAQVVAYLASGDTVDTSVWTTISPYINNQTPEDPLDSTYAPPFWYLGNGALTVA